MSHILMATMLRCWFVLHLDSCGFGGKGEILDVFKVCPIQRGRLQQLVALTS